jgi:hypothetical protein
MAKKAKQPHEDEAQSQRFIDLARELEAEGDLDPDRGERGLDQMTRRAEVPKEDKGRP